MDLPANRESHQDTVDRKSQSHRFVAVLSVTRRSHKGFAHNPYMGFVQCIQKTSRFQEVAHNFCQRHIGPMVFGGVFDKTARVMSHEHLLSPKLLVFSLNMNAHDQLGCPMSRNTNIYTSAIDGSPPGWFLEFQPFLKIPPNFFSPIFP